MECILLPALWSAFFQTWRLPSPRPTAERLDAFVSRLVPCLSRRSSIPTTDAWIIQLVCISHNWPSSVVVSPLGRIWYLYLQAECLRWLNSWLVFAWFLIVVDTDGLMTCCFDFTPTWISFGCGLYHREKEGDANGTEWFILGCSAGRVWLTAIWPWRVLLEIRVSDNQFQFEYEYGVLVLLHNQLLEIQSSNITTAAPTVSTSRLKVFYGRCKVSFSL